METRKETEQTQTTREEPVTNDDAEDTGAGSAPADEPSGNEE